MITEVHVSEIFKAIKLDETGKKLFRFIHTRGNVKPSPTHTGQDRKMLWVAINAIGWEKVSQRFASLIYILP